MAKSTINVRILGDNSDFRKALQDSDNRAKTFASNVGKAVGAGLATVAVGATAIGVASVKQASDLAESANAVRVTFGDQADAIQKLAEQAATGVGLSAAEFNGLAVQFSSFAANIAGPGGDVVATIDDITKRAADFASVMNLDVAEAAAVFQSGLAGETEPLKKYGIDLSAAAVEQYALANGIAASAAEMTEADKIQARYGLLMESTAKTAGDFANTSDGLANQQRVLSARVKDLSAKFGAALLPALESIAGVVADRVVPFLERNLPKAIEFVQSAIDGLVSFVRQNWGSISTAFDTTRDAIARVVEFFQSNQPALIGLIAAIGVGLAAWALSAAAAAAATALAIAPFLLAAAAIGAIVAVLIYAYREWETFRVAVDAVVQFLQTTWAELVAWVEANWPRIQATIEGVIEAVRIVIDTVVRVITELWQRFGDDIVALAENAWNTIKTVVESAINIVLGIINTVTSLIKGDWEGAWNGIKQILDGVWEGIKAIVSGAIDQVKIFISAGWEEVDGFFHDTWDGLKGFVSETWDAIEDFVSGGVDAVVGFVADLPGEIAGAVAGGFDSIWENFKGVINRIIDAWNNLEFSVPGVSVPGPLPDIPGFTVGTPNIPRLATGAVLTGPTLFVGGEYPSARRDPEIVAPRSMMVDAVREALGDGATGGGMVGLQVNGDVRLDGVGVEEVARSITFQMLAAA